MIEPPVGIVVALALERSALGALETDPAIVVGWRGIGATRAAAAARDLLERGAGALLSFGIATALDRTLAPGTLVVPAFVIEHDGGRLEAHPGWRERLVAAAGPGVGSGSLAEASEVLADAASKRRLGSETGACAADMESAAIARVAYAAGKPFAAVRAIADGAADRLPAAALAAVGDDGRHRPVAALRALLGAPRDLPAFCVVAVRGMRAAARLRAFAAAEPRPIPCAGEQRAGGAP